MLMYIIFVNFTLANYGELGLLVVSIQWVYSFFPNVYVCLCVFIYLSTCRGLKKLDGSVIFIYRGLR